MSEDENARPWKDPQVDLTKEIISTVRSEAPVFQVDLDRWNEQLAKEKRFVVGGNAGGLAASISLAAAWLRPLADGSDPSPLPIALFLLIVTFITGLALCAVAIILEGRRLRQRADMASKMFTDYIYAVIRGQRPVTQIVGIEPRRDCRRPFRLSHAAMADCSSMA